MRHHLSRGDDARGGGLSWAASSIRALAFSSLHSDRARDSRDHDDRVVQRDRGGREIDSGWLERITHLAENDIIAIAVVIVATGIAVDPWAAEGAGDRRIDRYLLAFWAGCSVGVGPAA